MSGATMHELIVAAGAVVREALDAVAVHPCDEKDDAVRARSLFGPVRALYEALAQQPQPSTIPADAPPEVVRAWKDGVKHGAWLNTPQGGGEPVALREVGLTRDVNGMCVVTVNGREAIRDNGDVISHFATPDWFTTAPAQQATGSGQVLTDAAAISILGSAMAKAAGRNLPNDNAWLLAGARAILAAATRAQPEAHRIKVWGPCSVCRHDRIPGEGCARPECPDAATTTGKPEAAS